MSHFAAVLDANVLITSVLLELAEARLYRPLWSKDIHEEWIRAVTRSRPDIAPEKLERRRAAMDRALPDACVSGYQRLIPAIERCLASKRAASDLSVTCYVIRQETDG